MEYSYKFRLYPNKEQENLIQRTFGCCRFVFNHFLAERMEQYKATGKSPTRFQQDKSLIFAEKRIGMATGSRCNRAPSLPTITEYRLSELLPASETKTETRLPQVQEQARPPKELQE